MPLKLRTVYRRDSYRPRSAWLRCLQARNGTIRRLLSNNKLCVQFKFHCRGRYLALFRGYSLQIYCVRSTRWRQNFIDWIFHSKKRLVQSIYPPTCHRYNQSYDWSAMRWRNTDRCGRISELLVRRTCKEGQLMHQAGWNLARSI